MTYAIGYISHEWPGWQDEEGYYLGSFAIDDKPRLNNTVPVAMIPYTGSGYYVGVGLVGQSNYRVIKDELAEDIEAGRIIEVYGSHGFKALYYRTDFPMPVTLANVLWRLDRYPLYNEDDHSELEHEVESEAWEDFGRKDFKRALETEYDGAVIDGMSCDAFFDNVDDAWLDAWWHYGVQKYNVEGGAGGHEDGNSGVWYFCIDDWIDKYRSSDDNVITGPVRPLLEL